MRDAIYDLLGDEADLLLNHKCQGIPQESLHLPGPDFVDRIFLTQRPESPGPSQSPATVWTRSPEGYRLRFHFAR